MRTGGGNAKGSSWEREACRALSMWVTAGSRSDVFWRSATSGARATAAYRTKGILLTAQAGDISLVAPEGHSLLESHFVECKHYSDLKIASWALNDTGFLSKFWREVENNARIYNRQPLLIAKQNFYPPFVVMRQPSLHFFNIDPDCCRMIVPRLNCGLLLFDVFLREARVPRTGDKIMSPKPCPTAQQLFDKLKHGDDKHRTWLLDALNAVFEGRPVPPPYDAKGPVRV